MPMQQTIARFVGAAEWQRLKWRKGRRVMQSQQCPICSKDVQPNARYPRYVCVACASRAASSDGRLLDFSNVDISGGFVARYSDTGELYLHHECFIDAVKCHADEARFGGIVIEAVGL